MVIAVIILIFAFLLYRLFSLNVLVKLLWDARKLQPKLRYDLRIDQKIGPITYTETFGPYGRFLASFKLFRSIVGLKFKPTGKKKVSISWKFSVE